MPELPEVEVIRSGLAPAVTGATVTSVTVFDARSLRRHDGSGEDFIDRLVGARIQAPLRRGKFLWLPLDSQQHEAIVIHLGMSGQLLVRTPGMEDSLTRIRMGFDNPRHGAVVLNFVDQRIFGSMAIDRLVPTTDSGDAIPSRVAHIARDPLDPLFDDARFIDQLRSRKTTIKRAMLDQSLISGIGNIYADESLWAARVHYNQPASSLSLAKAQKLLVEVRAVFGRALAEGGTSFDAQYLNVNGESGYFSHSLNAYGRGGEPCARCGTAIKRVAFMNRSSHFCPRCQRPGSPP